MMRLGKKGKTIMVKSNLRHCLYVLFIISSGIASPIVYASDDAVLDEARTLIKAGNHKAAYELLLPLESERSGNVDYDILLGASGVEAGENSRGIFALERVLAVQPNNLEARALIAKGYYKAGEADNAKSEFNNILSQNPSSEITKLIENNMLAIDKATGQKTAFAAYLDFGIGHDSNINSATSSSSINAIIPIVSPTLTPIPLTSDSREQSSNFVSTSAGISVRLPISKNISAFGSVAGASKFNWANEKFDTSSLDYSFGLNIKQNIDNFTIAIQGGSFDVGTETFRETVGLSGQWQRDLNDKNQISVFTQLSQLDYPVSPVRDAKRYVLGGAWGHAFDGDKAPVTYLTAYTGQEVTNDNDFDYFGHDLAGVRLGGQLVLDYKLIAFATASYEYRDYDGQDPAFLIARKDNQFDLNLGLRFLPGHNFTIKPQISYVDNHSNNSLYEFDRWIVSVNVRKDFNW